MTRRDLKISAPLITVVLLAVLCLTKALSPLPGMNPAYYHRKVWESIESLHDYVYTSAHLRPLQDRKSWFEPMKRPHLALWWVPENHLPDVAEAEQRLDHLLEHGHRQRLASRAGCHDAADLLFVFGSKLWPGLSLVRLVCSCRKLALNLPQELIGHRLLANASRSLVAV